MAPLKKPDAAALSVKTPEEQRQTGEADLHSLIGPREKRNRGMKSAGQFVVNMESL